MKMKNKMKGKQSNRERIWVKEASKTKHFMILKF